MATVTEKTAPGGYYTRDGWTITRAWDVEAASEADALDVLYTQTGVRRGVLYENHQGATPDLLCYLIEFQVRARVPAPSSATGLYEVIGEYRRITADARPRLPSDGTWQWHFEHGLSTAPADLDYLGHAILNSADEPPDPPLVREEVEEVLIGESIRFFSTQLAGQLVYRPYHNRLNSDTFMGCPPLCLKCDPVEVLETDYPWWGLSSPWLVRLRLRYRPQVTIGATTYGGWIDRRVHKGYRTKAEIAVWRKYRDILTEDGNVVTEPVRLTADGQRLPEGSPDAIGSWQLYSTIDYANLLTAGE